MIVEASLHRSIPHVTTIETSYHGYDQTYGMFGANPGIFLFSGCDGPEPCAVAASRRAIGQLIAEHPDDLSDFALMLMLHPDSMALGTDTWGSVRRNRLYDRDDLPFVAANLELVRTIKPRIIIGIHEDWGLQNEFYVYEYVSRRYKPLLSQTHPLFDQIQALGTVRFNGKDDDDLRLNNQIVDGYIPFTHNPNDGSFEVRAVYDPAFATTHAFILELPMHSPLTLKTQIVKTFLRHFLVTASVTGSDT